MRDPIEEPHKKPHRLGSQNDNEVDARTMSGGVLSEIAHCSIDLEGVAPVVSKRRPPTDEFTCTCFKFLGESS